VIEALRAFRQDSGLPLCFTLDAGPNVHILYPAAVATQVQSWLAEVINPLAEDGRIIHDRVAS
jgi:diphosphomevalonate decarboxylase